MLLQAVTAKCHPELQKHHFVQQDYMPVCSDMFRQALVTKLPAIAAATAAAGVAAVTTRVRFS